MGRDDGKVSRWWRIAAISLILLIAAVATIVAGLIRYHHPHPIAEVTSPSGQTSYTVCWSRNGELTLMSRQGHITAAFGDYYGSRTIEQVEWAGEDLTLKFAGGARVTLVGRGTLKYE